jgi:hypothetical protein
MTPARKASMWAALDREFGPRKAAKLVVDGGRIVGDAVVVVSPSDPNWFHAVRTDGEIHLAGGRMLSQFELEKEIWR